MNFKKIWLFILGFPKTLYFNFKYLPFNKAVKLPILVSHRVYLMECNGNIKIDAPINFGMIRIGFGQVSIFDQHKSRSIWKVTGNIVFKGNASIGHGSKISVAGLLTVGKNFIITAESQIRCDKSIVFGDDVLISWESLFIDSDSHKIIYNGVITNNPKDIVIGNRVWIGCRCTILKGVELCDGTVIAAGSVVTGVFNDENVIIGGNPSIIIRKNIRWEL